MEDAESAAVRVHEAITSGDIAVRPTDPQKCQWCDFRDICRVESAALVQGRNVTLSDDQRRAVERIGQDVCVVAGPGSGKTRVLTERFAWLVETHGVDPDAILAITFTEKAANEIKSRLIQRFAAPQPARHGKRSSGPGYPPFMDSARACCRRMRFARACRPISRCSISRRPTGWSAKRPRRSLDAMYREQPDRMRRLLEALDLSTQDDGRQPDLAESLLTLYESMRLSGISGDSAADRSHRIV